VIDSMKLPIEAFAKPQTWSSMTYKWVQGKGWIPQGYTKPTVQTFYDHTGKVMDLTRQGLRTISWVYYNGEWVKV
jgi:hypothetical protein